LLNLPDKPATVEEIKADILKNQEMEKKIQGEIPEKMIISIF